MEVAAESREEDRHSLQIRAWWERLALAVLERRVRGTQHPP